MWKPIDTLEFSEKYSWGDCSKTVLMYVKNFDFSDRGGIVVAEIRRHKIDNGWTIYVSGVSGYDYENEFGNEDVTHWMELPEPPSANEALGDR